MVNTLHALSILFKAYITLRDRSYCYNILQVKIQSAEKLTNICNNKDLENKLR